MEVVLGRAMGMGRVPFVSTLRPKYPRAAKIHGPQKVAKAFIDGQPITRRIWIFLLVRNPFDFMMSAFFQNYDRRIAEAKLPAGHHYNLSQLMPLFSNDVARMSEHTGITRYLQFVLGLTNLTQTPLDMTKTVVPPFLNGSRHAWFLSQRFRTIFLRLEDSLHWPSIIYYRTGLFANVSAHPQNVGLEKWYSSMYSQFKAAYIYPEDVVSRVLAMDQDLQLLYSEAERAQIACKALHTCTPVLR
jgi:hypothetical protein